MKRHVTYNIKQLNKKYMNGSVDPCLITQHALEDACKLKYLNAFIHITKELASKQAQKSAKRYADKQCKGPLDGVTIAIKDNFCTKHIKTTCASKMLSDFIPNYNATACERLCSHGAVLIGKTNMDEFAMGSGTIDSFYGPTKNMWSNTYENDQWRIVGGSSGGSASAVATGICYGALGSDTGGSVRNPASYCGVVGYKPTYGLISRHGLIPLVNSMDCPGIFARSISDCVTLLNCIAGPDDYDATTIKQPFQKINLPLSDNLFDIKKIRIGIPKEFHCIGLSQDATQCWQHVADTLSNAGADVRLVSLPHTAASILVYTILNYGEVASNMAKYDGVQYGHRAQDEHSTESLYAKTRNEAFNTVVKLRILCGNYFLIKENYQKYYEKALKGRRLIMEDYRRIFVCGSEEEKVDILLTPTTLSAALTFKEFRKCSNEEQCFTQDWCTTPANVTGLPAISIPIHLNGEGLPLSVQLMANTQCDELLFLVAQWIEAQYNFQSCHYQYLEKFLNCSLHYK